MRVATLVKAVVGRRTRCAAFAALASLAWGTTAAAPLVFDFAGTVSADAVDPTRVGTALTGTLRFDPDTAALDSLNATSRTATSRTGGWMSIEIRYAGGVVSSDRVHAPRQQGWAQILDDVPSGVGFNDQMNFRTEQQGANFEYATLLGLVLDSRDTAFVSGFDFAQSPDLSLLNPNSGGYLRRHDERVAGQPVWIHDAQFSIDGFRLRAEDEVHAVAEPPTLALALAGLLAVTVVRGGRRARRIGRPGRHTAGSRRMLPGSSR